MPFLFRLLFAWKETNQRGGFAHLQWALSREKTVQAVAFLNGSVKSGVRRECLPESHTAFSRIDQHVLTGAGAPRCLPKQSRPAPKSSRRPSKAAVSSFADSRPAE